MTRRDGRELVTEFPVTARDRVEYIPREELQIPEDATRCTMSGISDSTWMDDDPSSDDFDDWGA